jgi:hypothetical protein
MKQTQTTSEIVDVLALLLEFINDEDPETAFRAVTGIGTIAAIGPSVKMYLTALEIKSNLQSMLVPGKPLEDRMQKAIQETFNLL